MPSLTPSERRLRAQIAAHTSWGNTADRTKRSEPGRRAADHRFYDQALERNPELSGDALEQAAASLRSAYFKQLAFRSAQARRKAAS